jgi:transposase
MSYLMDNCVIHRTNKLKEYVKKEKMYLIYNVPYHSEKNPIETVFSVLKNKINRSINNSYEDVIKIIVEFKEKLSNIYRNSFKLYSQIL